MDFLKSAVASAISKGPPFPYTFGDRVDVDQSIWTLHNGIKREDGSKCSIFSFDVSANKHRLPLAKNAVRKLRTLRHPGIVRILDSVETETYIYVAAERVTPLSWPLRGQSLSIERTKWGLYTVANTLRFIHDEASSVHGAIRVSSIFTSESGEWRIGGLEILSSMKEDDAVIYTYATLLPAINLYSPPEVVKTGWDTIKRNPVAATDSYDFGILIYEVFNGGTSDSGKVGQTTNIPPSILQSYKRLLNANPKARLTVSHFLEQGCKNGGFFETPLIRLSQGVENLGLKSDGERTELLSELDDVSDDFPEEFVRMKVLPELLKSVEFGGGGPKVFGVVMKIGAKLTEDEYESMLNPVIIRLFGSPDRQIRVCLLDNLPQMIDHLSQKTVTDKIFPQLVTGFTDIAPVVREQTVKSILTIISKLSDRTINGELLKYLAKTANDEQPGIRTNTTICLGKIARNMGTNTRQKVLIAAFTRSLRDPFVHARNAALQALAATSDLFPEEDCANKILPGMCPSLVDKEKIVRDQANRTFDVYVSRIRKYSTQLPDTILPPTNSTNTNGSTPRMGTPQNDTSWAGWAISSFTNSISSASGEIETKPNMANLPRISQETRSSSVIPIINQDSLRPKPRSTLALQDEALKKPVPPTIMRTATDHFFSDAQAEDDEVDEAWGDMDEESFFDAPTAQAVTTLTPFDDVGEPDFAGWLTAQAQAKSKNPLPKGMTRAGASTTTTGRSVVPRGTSTGSVGTGLGAKKAAVTSTLARTAANKTKTIDIKPKQSAADDDWGDAWD